MWKLESVKQIKGWARRCTLEYIRLPLKRVENVKGCKHRLDEFFIFYKVPDGKM